jgi:glycosyltransferase involved in cell wall biosynthesis
VHCRSFPAALIGYKLNRSIEVPYIFDFRDFYAENGLAKARGLSRLFYKYFKHMERPMIRSAAKVVCLTKRATEVLSEWYLKDEIEPKRRFMVIPCCADFDHYDPAKVASAARQAALAKAGLEGAEFVLLYLGSLGAEYLLDEMMALFRQVQAVRPDARFLFVCNNGRELVDEACQRQGIDTDAIRFVTADRDDVPAFIALANLSVIFIRSDISKAGCSPTKLAELLAMNVPVIANSGVGDLDTLLDIRTNGSTTVSGFDDATLRASVEDVVRAAYANRTDIRGASSAFDLDEGVRRYAVVYNELLRQ